MGTRSKIIGVVVGCAVLVVAAGFGCWVLFIHLPSDQKAKRYFQAHQAQFIALATSLTKQPAVSFLDTRGNGQDAKVLKRIGGQFVRQSEGAITIYVWGRGCAICHDSYEGYIYIPQTGHLLKGTGVVQALDRDLPKDGHGGVEDGFYVLPLADGWYVFREENG